MKKKNIDRSIDYWERRSEDIMWLVMAVLSAFFAGLTSILAKCGIKKTDSDVVTALRTTVVLLFSCLMVFVAGSFEQLLKLEGKSVLFLILSGLATGASWICYFKALSMGEVNKVVPVDKSSTILSVLAAIILFGETQRLAGKLIGTVILAVGIYLMVEKKPELGNKPDEAVGDRPGWMRYALFSAVFAALTSILAKIGITGVESNLGTAIRTCVVLVMSWVIVFAKKKQSQIKRMERKEQIYIILSGIATGISWLCYYYAIQNGIVSVVVPIDKLSIIVTVIFSYLVFKEKLSRKAFAGLLFLISGTIVMVVCL